MPEIVAIGECMIELFSDEPIGSADTFQRAYAGDTNNVLHMASKLGTSCGYVTRAAEDHFGDYLLGAWRENGIDTSAVRRVPGFTAVHFISLLPDGDREFIYYRKGSAASTMTPNDLDPDYIGAARVLHVGGIIQAVSPNCRATVLRAARIAGERGVTVSFDTNLRANMWTPSEAREALDEIVPHVDVLYISYPDETTALLGVDSPDEAVDFFRQRGVGTIAVTSGPKRGPRRHSGRSLSGCGDSPQRGCRHDRGWGRIRGRIPPLPCQGPGHRGGRQVGHRLGRPQGCRTRWNREPAVPRGRGSASSTPSRSPDPDLHVPCE